MQKTTKINSDLLNTKIEESGLKLGYISDTIGISRQALSKKINNKTSFRISEVYVMCDLLHLDADDRKKIFFCEC